MKNLKRYMRSGRKNYILQEVWSDPVFASSIILRIKEKAERFNKLYGRSIHIMEVCGTHTFAIAKSGIREFLRGYVHLTSGPGCPVCVTSQDDIDAVLEIGRIKGVIITTFGDMVKVKGSDGKSLNDLRMNGGDVRVVYSPMDAVYIAKENPMSYVVFIGVGFETTAPTVAASVKYAFENNIKNFYVASFFKLVPPALRYLLDFKIGLIDGFILPGHVSVIIGRKSYDFIEKEYSVPSVISGFEPIDILRSIDMILDKKLKKESVIENEYTRAVNYEGNSYALSLINEIFEICDAKWRAVGVIKNSGYRFSKKYDIFDAIKRFSIHVEEKPEPKGCLCGQILLGLKKPTDCTLFGKRCTPNDAVGPCMVSSEGACAAWYRYGIRE